MIGSDGIAAVARHGNLYLSITEEMRQMAYKPGSVHRPRAVGWPFIWDARYRAPRATDPDGGAEMRLAVPLLAGRPSLLGLAPGGVYHAVPVAGPAVRSYRTLSPFPAALKFRRARPCVASGGAGGLLSVALSLGLPPPDVIRHRISVEPGLSSPLR